MKKAFTLAEVLITLGIIGIVAAMTLPSLVNNNRNKQLETGLKKAYSTLSQALDMYQAKTGERLVVSDSSYWSWTKNVMMPYFINTKDCGMGSADADTACIPNNEYLDEDKKTAIYKTFNGKNDLKMRAMDDGQFIINDGMLILLNVQPETSELYISVDVNGFNKRPNKAGQDLFTFQIDSKGTLRPMGAPGTEYYNNENYCSTTSTSNENGLACTYKALTEKDYFKNLPK